MHIDFESVSMVTSQRSFCPVLEREGHELSRLPSVSMWTSWHFKNIAFCFLKKLPKVFNSPISNPSLQKETINMISSHCVKYQDACTEAVDPERMKTRLQTSEPATDRKRIWTFSGGSRRDSEKVEHSKRSKGEVTHS